MKRIILAIRKFFAKKKKEEITYDEFFRRVKEVGTQYYDDYKFIR